MYEEDHKSFGEKLHDFFFGLIMVIVVGAICVIVPYFLLGMNKHKVVLPFSQKEKVETSKETSKEVEDLVINSDYKEPARVVIINEDGSTFFEYYGIVNTTEKDGQTNIVVDVRENEGR